MAEFIVLGGVAACFGSGIYGASFIPLHDHDMKKNAITFLGGIVGAVASYFAGKFIWGVHKGGDFMGNLPRWVCNSFFTGVATSIGFKIFWKIVGMGLGKLTGPSGRSANYSY